MWEVSVLVMLPKVDGLVVLVDGEAEGVSDMAGKSLVVKEYSIRVGGPLVHALLRREGKVLTSMLSVSELESCSDGSWNVEV